MSLSQWSAAYTPVEYRHTSDSFSAPVRVTAAM